MRAAACGVCLACGSAVRPVRHHPAGSAVAPGPTIILCEACHEGLHASHARLWRSPSLSGNPIETARVALMRIVETLELLGPARTAGIVVALDRAAETLIDAKRTVLLWFHAQLDSAGDRSGAARAAVMEAARAVDVLGPGRAGIGGALDAVTELLVDAERPVVLWPRNGRWV